MPSHCRLMYRLSLNIWASKIAPAGLIPHMNADWRSRKVSNATMKMSESWVEKSCSSPGEVSFSGSESHITAPR